MMHDAVYLSRLGIEVWSTIPGHGVARSTIEAIKSGRNWGHLKD